MLRRYCHPSAFIHRAPSEAVPTGDSEQKAAVRKCGGVEALLALLDGSPEQPMTVVAAETLSCLAVDDVASRVSLTLSRKGTKCPHCRMRPAKKSLEIIVPLTCDCAVLLLNTE
jgi:hypothetical protein